MIYSYEAYKSYSHYGSVETYTREPWAQIEAPYFLLSNASLLLREAVALIRSMIALVNVFCDLI